MPLELFYSYSHKDAALRDELEVHLSQLVRDGLILPWADRCIPPGTEWSGEIDQHVHSAQVILLLVSPDFLASDYCYGKEMQVALERHNREHTVVVPIILRPCDWHSAPFARLQALPRLAVAVTLWPNRDEAFAQIAQSIREVVVRFQQPQATPLKPTMLEDRLVPSTRMVDAAMPSHIVKDRATELLVLIRLPESKGLAGILQEDDEAEARPEDVRSKPFDVTFPLGPSGFPEPLKLTIQVTSPDFEPPSQIRNIFVPIDRDSPLCHFLLTPKRIGALLVVIELIWEDAERGNRRLKTTCVSEADTPATPPPLVLVQMPVGTRPVATLKNFGLAVGAAAGIDSAPAPAPAFPGPGELKRIFKEAPYSPAPVIPSRVGTAGSPRSPNLPESLPSASKSSSWHSSRLAKVGLAVCIVTLGSTFFVFQTARNASVPSGRPAPQIATSSLQQKMNTAEVEFQQISKAVAHPPNRSPASDPVPASVPVETAAIIKQGQNSLAAAKSALAKGNTAEAKKHLAAVEAANLRLRSIHNEQMGR